MIEKVFNSLSPELIKAIEEHAIYQNFEEGEVLMKTGQFIKSVILVLTGKIKVYREDDEGKEFFMYYILPGQACAISMICAAKMETSEIMAKVNEKAEVVSRLLKKMEQKNWLKLNRNSIEIVELPVV